MLTTVLCIVVALVLIVIEARARLIAESEELVESIAAHEKKGGKRYNSCDILDDLEKCHQGAFIAATQKSEFKGRYKCDFDKACALHSRLKKFRIATPEPLLQFINR